mmetsp:Transcript_4107/g.13123  ORF Transcript_4107/g.13123 Transcript_4107/m.13123 type:complete len:357 (+) Transcript_4107:2868-3938(+)
MLAPLTLTPIVVRWRAPPDVSANAAELSSKGMPSLTSPTVRSRVTSRPPMPEGNVADHVMSESPRSGHDSVNVRLMRRVPASLPGFIRTASSSLAQRQWTAARRTGSSDSTSTASSATTRGTLIATKSVKWLHRQPTLSIVALSTTVSHPSVLHPSSSSSQKRHSSAASQLLYPAFIRSKSSRCDGWPMQFRSASPVLVTGRARMIGSSSNCVIFVSLAKMEKETAGPARLSDRLSEPPCTFRFVVHMATVTGSPLCACCATRSGSWMVALAAPLVLKVSVGRSVRCTEILSEGATTEMGPVAFCASASNAWSTRAMVLRTSSPASTAFCEVGAGYSSAAASSTLLMPCTAPSMTA